MMNRNAQWMLSLLGLTTLLYGCGEGERGSLNNAEIFVVGDSAFEWHLWSGRSAPERMGEELNRPIYNAARSGQMLTEGLEYSIPNQYIDGDWDWVVINGGFNDLADLCRCGDCPVTQANVDAVLEAFVEERVDEGKQVIIWTYYNMPDKSQEMKRCKQAVRVLRQNQKTLADSDPNIFWVDGRQAISADNRKHFFIDNLHPSRLGAERMGNQIAKAIRRAEKNAE